jgi:glycosyltransferase involved in cell wall biosynthesis
MAGMNKVSSLTVFFPCFNEEKNIRPLVTAYLEVLPQIAGKFEIIIINDGSTDRTSEITRKLSRKYPQVKLINHLHNQGYGASIRTGINHAQFDWVFFTDGDGQYEPRQLLEFIPHTPEFKAIIGYRTNRAEGSLRAFNARLFKLFIDLLFRVHVKDIDCAFKLFQTDTVSSFPLISTGAMISAEILYRLKKKRIRFKQLPVVHLPRRFGRPTGNHPKVVFRAGWEALKLYTGIKLGFI